MAFYDPQVDNWTPELAREEAVVKEKSTHLLFVIDKQTRATASCLEAVEYICRGREVILVIDDLPEGIVITGAEVAGGERKDLNRMREYLRETAERHATAVYGSVEAACRAIAAAHAA